MIKLVAKLPRKKIGDTTRIAQGVSQELRNFAYAVQRDMQYYPPARSPKWRRTGSYGRGWTGNTHYTPLSVTIINSVNYATFVGGTRQRSYHRAHGWKNIHDVAEEMRPKWAAAIRKVIIS